MMRFDMFKRETTRDDKAPLAVTVPRASELTGLGVTTLWVKIKQGELVAVRPPGIRRTLVSYESLRRFLDDASTPPPKRGRGRPRKTAAQPEATASQEAVTP
jgi:hypothetical protein